jgi:hypothetical protein
MKFQPLATAAVIALLTLGACATPTPYQPQGAPGAMVSGGYREVRIEPDRWRVTFSGNSLTSRERVETYLLYRSAELTVQTGYDWFATAQRATSEHTRVIVSHDPHGVWGPGWGPSWRYRDHAGWRGWRTWDPMGPDPFFDVQQIVAYEASAEIVMRHGADAFDARAVLASLEGKVARPQ